MFENKHIVVGISGGIAAFKAAGLVSQLRQKGADVHCIMTANAAKLVTPITFGELSGNDVTVDMFANISKWDVEHIALAKLADLFIVAPATADIIGKVANGIADDMLSTTIMATKAKVLFVPSMNTNMYENPIVQANMEKLRSFGYEFVEPESGHLACNTSGKGRFPTLETIMDCAEKCIYGRDLLKGRKVVVSAGGTQEKIDPVRFISNRSSGRQGYAIAKAAWLEGADVTLVSCTTALPAPYGVKMVYVQDARELERAMNTEYDSCDAATFAYFYTNITFNPLEIANNMKRSGGFIPGIRPGKPTSDYLNQILNYIVFIGAIGLAFIAFVPIFFNGVFNADVSFGGTSIIIIFGVVIETLKQVESQMLVRNYKGFLND